MCFWNLAKLYFENDEVAIKVFCLLFFKKVGCQQVFHKVARHVGKVVETVWQTRYQAGAGCWFYWLFSIVQNFGFGRSRDVDLGKKLHKNGVFNREFSNPQLFVEKSKIGKKVKISILCPKMRHLANFRRPARHFSTFRSGIINTNSTGEISSQTLEK